MSHRHPAGSRGIAMLAMVATIVVACGQTASTSPGTQVSSASPGASSGAAASPSPARSTPRPQPAADVAIEVVLDGLTAPVGLVAPPDGSGRLFILEQAGSILVLKDGERETQPFLDISDRVVPLTPDYDERGLLGLAFHPDFANNGRFFVYYGAPLRKGAPAGLDHTNTLSEFRADPADPSRADQASERILLQFEQPQFNHSGGGLGFGPDGFLYLGTGDGGGQGDASEGHSPQGNAQDTAKLNGKILRIDVDGKEPYAIPSDNPFATSGGEPEIYAYGFRNPWRLSWEPAGQRRLLVSDVGYGRYEEIDVVVNGGNYGWRIREGAHCLDVDAPLTDPTDCQLTGAGGEPLIDPVVEYSHRAVGVAVVGGYRYRGSALTSLRDQYVFADFSGDPTNDLSTPLGSLLVATPEEADGAPWEWRRLKLADGRLNRFVTGMGEDADGELYVMTRLTLGSSGTTGEVLRLVAPAP